MATSYLLNSRPRFNNFGSFHSISMKALCFLFFMSIFINIYLLLDDKSYNKSEDVYSINSKFVFRGKPQHFLDFEDLTEDDRYPKVEPKKEVKVITKTVNSATTENIMDTRLDDLLHRAKSKTHWKKHLKTLHLQDQNEKMPTTIFDTSRVRNLTLLDVMDGLDCNRPSTYNHRRQLAIEFFSEDAILERTKDCANYFQKIPTMAFEDHTELEKTFHMAFSIGLHHHVGIFEAFLALYWRPMDPYCIHIDIESDEKVKRAIRAIMNCYQEYFPESTFFEVPNPIPVTWGADSVLKIDFLCMEHLRNRTGRWRLFLNPAGSELPLMPINKLRQEFYERTRYLSIVKQHNNLHFEKRQNQTVVRDSQGNIEMVELDRSNRQDRSCNFTILKGLKNVALKKSFVTFLMDHPVSKAYWQFLESTAFAEEHFYSTLSSVFTEEIPKDASMKLMKKLSSVNNPEGKFLTPKGLPGHYPEWKSKSDYRVIQYTRGIKMDLKCYNEWRWSSNQCKFVGTKCEDESSKFLKFLHEFSINREKQPCMRVTKWSFHRQPCYGQYIRRICNYGVRDLPIMRKDLGGCVFGNKFNLVVDSAAVLCQIKDIWQKSGFLKPLK